MELFLILIVIVAFILAWSHFNGDDQVDFDDLDNNDDSDSGDSDGGDGGD